MWVGSNLHLGVLQHALIQVCDLIRTAISPPRQVVPVQWEELGGHAGNHHQSKEPWVGGRVQRLRPPHIALKVVESFGILSAAEEVHPVAFGSGTIVAIGNDDDCDFRQALFPIQTKEGLPFVARIGGGSQERICGSKRPSRPFGRHGGEAVDDLADELAFGLFVQSRIGAAKGQEWRSVTRRLGLVFGVGGYDGYVYVKARLIQVSRLSGEQ